MENILSVDLSSETSPVVQEVRGRDYIEYGTEEWRNLYPQFLIDLYYNSSTHAAIINTTAEMIAGEDIVVEESENLEQFVKLKKFFAEANGKESLHEVIKKLSFDFKLQGAFAIHIIWNKAKTEISEIYHVPVERVRASRPNAMGVVYGYGQSQAVNDRYTSVQILHNTTENVYEGKVDFKPNGYWTYEIYEVSWQGSSVVLGSGTAPINENDVLSPVANTKGVVKGRVELGKLLVSETVGSEEVQYNQHPEPSGTNYIYYGQ